jgi:hypothetical protein
MKTYGSGISRDDRRIIDEVGKYKGLNIAISPRRQPKTFKWLDGLLRREGVRRPGEQ